MKAAYIEQVGPPQAIQYGDLPMPTVGRKDVLVKVVAVEVNAVDTYIRSGSLKTALPFPDQMNVWFARGLPKGKIAQQLPLSHAAEAHQLYETRSLFGKLVLVPE